MEILLRVVLLWEMIYAMINQGSLSVHFISVKFFLTTTVANTTLKLSSVSIRLRYALLIKTVHNHH